MVSNAVSVLISIEHLNISMKIFQVNLFMTEKRAELISSKTVKTLNLETSLRDAMHACVQGLEIVCWVFFYLWRFLAWCFVIVKLHSIVTVLKLVFGYPLVGSISSLCSDSR